MGSDSTSKASPSPPPPPRDFLLHLEAYLAKRDGVDKLLKISRYATKILLASSSSLSASPRLKAFDSSVGASRKAFRLGKFVQDFNALRLLPPSSNPRSPAYLALFYVAYGGEGVYYFVEQFVWLMKAGLLSKEYARRLQLISAWAELVGYVGSVGLKVGEVRRIREGLEKVREEEEGKLREKLLLKQISIVQDLADGLMALADVREGKGYFTGPLLMASAGLLSALISTLKNWRSC